jgi:hypothetical protein
MAAETSGEQPMGPWFDLDLPTRLMFQFGWFLMTRANFVVYVLLLAVFVAGISIRLPGARAEIAEVEAAATTGQPNSLPVEEGS